MAQDNVKILPKFINTDASYDALQPNEAPFIKGIESGINGNPSIGLGMDNGVGEGQNSYVLTPSKSNTAVPNVILPKGFNKTVLIFESLITQELYVGNYNSRGNHGIYVFNGNDETWAKVIIDPTLSFSENPTAFVAEHRATLRIKRNSKGEIIEKYLLYTDGNTPHKWIDVIAAIKTDGFNDNVYPYFKLQPPHFDREELIAWAVRSPMVAPKAKLLPNNLLSTNKQNNLVGYAFEFCFQDIYTDGRESLTSPFSVPSIIKKTDFLGNANLIPKNIELELVAGSSKVEKKNIFVRKTLRKAESDLQVPFGDWYLYDTIYKYSDSGANSFSVIGNDYWKRTNQWSNYNYDSVKNTIKYLFDNTKLGLITDQDLFTRLGNEMPQLSVAMSDLGDAVQLANNRKGYANVPQEITNKINSLVNYQSQKNCVLGLREIKLYVYVGRERGNQSIANAYRRRDVWHSQVGYYVGEDTQMRFGGQYMKQDDGVQFDVDEGKYFELNFADKDSFRCYLKGTQYYADAEWYYSRFNYNLVKLPQKININNPQDLTIVNNVERSGGFFVGVFTFKVPAGHYIATLGRHNVAKDGNYRDTSTYIMGIANSRLASYVTYRDDNDQNVTVNTVRPTAALVSNSKEIEIDCTSSNVDVWGNGADLFYVYCPFSGKSRRELTNSEVNRWQFVEGYLYESADDKKPMEKYPYEMSITGGERGVFTDKNGFFFACVWGESSQNEEDLVFNGKRNCNYPSPFTYYGLSDSPEWKPNNIVYFDINNDPTFDVGYSNRVELTGTVTDLTGAIPYSNIAVSIVDGSTDYTDDNGQFTIIVHNAINADTAIRRLYINAAGNFNVFGANCSIIAPIVFNEPPCSTTSRRLVIQNYNTDVQSAEATSLKSGASYSLCVVLADIASRVTFASKIGLNTVDFFTQRNNNNPSFLSWFINTNLGLNLNEKTKDAKWISFFVTNNKAYKKYIQWIGDKIEFVDDNGNVTTNTSSASLVKITISSLLETNIKNNLTLLSNYQFQQEDRIRIYDDGDGNLLNTTQYGELIDVEVQGTNYNQSAVNANLIAPPENTVLTNTNTATDPTVVYAKYDQRFNNLKDKTGFWIELYTPSQITEKIPLSQIEGYYPIINGEIAEYVGGGQQNPVYNFPTSGNLNYWDTYLIRRTIFGLGKYIAHPFESPNVTDTFGANCQSGGKQNTINENAATIWYNDETIKSDDYLSENKLNGLSFFRDKNIKNFKGIQRGGIVACISQNSIVLFICENDYFTTDYNFNYIFANAQGVQVANLDNNLSLPHQKIGMNFGCRYQDTSSILKWDEYVFWIDTKSQASILSDYRSAADVSSITDEEGKMYGIKSYLTEKIRAIEQWNFGKEFNNRFDILTGIDVIKKDIYVTFRPRRKNLFDLHSFVNERRGIDTLHQETAVYNLNTKRWTRWANFTPEAYGKVRGNKTGQEMVTFAGGKPYLNNKNNVKYLEYFGIQTEPILTLSVNKNNNQVKILQSISVQCNGSNFFVDTVYSTQLYGLSYIPLSSFVEKEKVAYAAFLKDMVTYLQDPTNNDYRSTLIDGKRIFGDYFIVRLVQALKSNGNYFQLDDIYFQITASVPTKPPNQ